MKQKKVVSVYLTCTLLASLHTAQLQALQLAAPVSVGELIDKITILEIKSNTIKNPDKLKNVLFEKQALSDILELNVTKSTKLTELTTELLKTNQKMWDIEDSIREKEAKKEFDDEFIQIARSVYFTNDHRGKIKRDINLLTQSSLIEEKQYTEYQ